MFRELLFPLGLAIVGWTQSVLLSLQTWESVRYARKQTGPARREDNPYDSAVGFGREHVSVMIPCKGNGDDLASNLQPLFEQEYANYELVFLVESHEDGADIVLQELIFSNRHLAPARVVYTGRAIESGQKVHNLLRAISKLDNRASVFAFVDSDACPNREWLMRLVQGLNDPRTGAVTGYRWMIPQSNHPANLLLFSLNSALAGLMGPGGHYFVWGGSWAIRRSTFDAIGLCEAWHGTLSDDLVASRALHAAGFKVRFSPHCVSRSEIDGNWTTTLEFIRRQYLIARRYAPRLWSLGVASHIAGQAGIWGSLGWALLGTGSVGRTLAAMTFVCLYGMAVLRGHWRQRLAACFAHQDLERIRWARRVDVWLSPAFGLLNLLLLLGSAVGSQVEWRGIRYWISPSGRIQTLGRQLDADRKNMSVVTFPGAAEEGEEDVRHDTSDHASNATRVASKAA